MSEVSRRAFSAAALTAASYSRILGANDRIRAGVLGSGSRAQYLMRLSVNLPQPVEFAAVSDVYEPARDGALKIAPNAKAFPDHRAVLDLKDIDAVYIGSPDHWHIPMLIDAVNAGKDVYCEKPVSKRIEEHEPAIRAVRANQRIVQVGYQQRSYPHYQMARDLVQAGKLGSVALVHTYWYQRVRVPLNITTDPAKVDWARFCGAAQVPYSPVKHRAWRWFWAFGGGHLTDLFSHWLDAAHMILGVDTPTRAQAMGANIHVKEFEVPDTITASFLYGEKLAINYSGTLNGNVNDGGQILRGSIATMELTRGGFKVFPEDGPRGEPMLQMKSLRDGTIDHIENFLDCVRTRKDPNSNIESACASARVAHLGNLAFRDGKTITW